jgi:hypothetical protein
VRVCSPPRAQAAPPEPEAAPAGKREPKSKEDIEKLLKDLNLNMPGGCGARGQPQRTGAAEDASAER